MSLMPCKECGKNVSSEAKACPNCGAAVHERTGLGTWVFFLFMLAVLGKVLIETQGSSTPAVAQAAMPKLDVSPVALEKYRAPFLLNQKDGRKLLADELLELCRREDGHLNYIAVKVRPAGKGAGLYCVHDFYNRYSLSLGSRAPAMSSWVSDHHALLAQNKITRVGVWGTGEYATGAWFEVN